MARRHSLIVLTKIKTETGKVARRKSEGKDKMNSDKGMDLKYLSVNRQIMNAYRKIKRKDLKRLKRPKGHTFWGSPNDLLL